MSFPDIDRTGRPRQIPTPQPHGLPPQSAVPGQFRPTGYFSQYHASAAPGPYSSGPYGSTPPDGQYGAALCSLLLHAPFPGAVYPAPGYPAQYAHFNRPAPVLASIHPPIPVNAPRQSTGEKNNRNGNRRPSASEIQLNLRIMGARDAQSILSIVEAEHGVFDAVNAATACSRLAKTRQGSSHGPRLDDRRVQTLLATVTRLSADLHHQEVANTLWALATLGWQAAEGSMRCALEGAAVRVAPSMNAQGVSITVWALATLGWQAAEGSMRRLPSEYAGFDENFLRTQQAHANTRPMPASDRMGATCSRRAPRSHHVGGLLEVECEG
jgi:hypothetical protein